MKAVKNCHISHQQAGSALIILLMIFTLSTLVVSALMSSSQNNAKMQQVVEINQSRYYNVEKTIGTATAWFEENEDKLVDLFEDTNLASNFTKLSVLDSSYSGTNQTATDFAVPTLVNTTSNNFPIISNNNTFAVSDFPLYDAGGANEFDFVADFIASVPNADNGGVNTKVSLINVIDSGSGGYSPVFRVDAITGNAPDRGTNLYSYVYGKYLNVPTTTTTTTTTPPTATEASVSSQSYGFYGEDKVDMSGSSFCKSKVFIWNGSGWTLGADASNCLVQSANNIDLAGGGTRIHGTARAGGNIDNENLILNNNAGGCEGAACTGDKEITAKQSLGGTIDVIQGSSDSTVDIDNTWLTNAHGACASFSNRTISSNTTLTNGGCYDTLSINNRKTATFKYQNGTDATNVFFIKTLNMAGNRSRVEVDFSGANPEDQKVVLFVNEFTGHPMNAKMSVNSDNAPHQLVIIYTGSDMLNYNGGANTRAHMYLPYAKMLINGNFSFFGAINAKEIQTIGTADLFSDEVEHTFNTIETITTPGSITTSTHTVNNPKLTFEVTKLNQWYH